MTTEWRRCSALAAVLKDGKPVMILNFDGKEITPSVVGTDVSGNLLVGEQAKAQLMMAPERTAMEIKRRMGSTDKISLGKQHYTPVELSSMILSYVKRYASAYLEEDIERAVISVPAYFDDIKRQATVVAGRQAGFTVERIINEPTAAALCYGLGHIQSTACSEKYQGLSGKRTGTINQPGLCGCRRGGYPGGNH